MTLPAPPCPNCGCGPSCNIYADTFGSDTIANYTQVDGSWAISSGTLDPPSTGLLKVNAAEPGTGDGVILTTSFTAGSSTGTFLFIIDYVDDDNYHYAEIIVTGASAATLRLGKRSGGANTNLTATVSIGSFSNASTYSVYVCRKGDMLAAQITTFLFSVPITTVRVARSTMHGGTFAALKTTSVGASARFDNLEYQLVSDDCENCAIAGCSSLCTFLPLSVSITFSNIDECSGFFNATWVVDYGTHADQCCAEADITPSPSCGGVPGIDWCFQAGPTMLILMTTATVTYEFTSDDLGTAPLDCSELGTISSFGISGGSGGSLDATCEAVVNP